MKDYEGCYLSLLQQRQPSAASCGTELVGVVALFVPLKPAISSPKSKFYSGFMFLISFSPPREARWSTSSPWHPVGIHSLFTVSPAAKPQGTRTGAVLFVFHWYGWCFQPWPCAYKLGSCYIRPVGLSLLVPISLPRHIHPRLAYHSAKHVQYEENKPKAFRKSCCHSKPYAHARSAAASTCSHRLSQSRSGSFAAAS